MNATCFMLFPFSTPGTTTLSGGELKKSRENELKRVNHHRLMWLYRLFYRKIITEGRCGLKEEVWLFRAFDTVGKLLWFLLLSSARIRNQRASLSSNEKEEKEDDPPPAT